jgi:uncharacterized protein (TIGR03435 family)
MLPGGSIESRGNSLRNLISWSYGLNSAYQRVEGKQDLLELEVDISARAATAILKVTEAKAMMRTLLEERFQLRWHWQPKEIDSYQLMPARADGRPGPALHAVPDDCALRASRPSVSFTSLTWAPPGPRH